MENCQQSFESFESFEKFDRKQEDKCLEETEAKKTKVNIDRKTARDRKTVDVSDRKKEDREETRLAYLLGSRPGASMGEMPEITLASNSSSSSTAWGTVTPPVGSAPTWGGGRGLSSSSSVISNLKLNNASLCADKPGLPHSVAVHSDLAVQRRQKPGGTGINTD